EHGGDRGQDLRNDRVVLRKTGSCHVHDITRFQVELARQEYVGGLRQVERENGGGLAGLVGQPEYQHAGTVGGRRVESARLRDGFQQRQRLLGNDDRFRFGHRTQHEDLVAGVVGNVDAVARLQQRVLDHPVAGQQSGKVDGVALAVPDEDGASAAGVGHQPARQVDGLQYALGGVVEGDGAGLVDCAGHFHAVGLVTDHAHANLRVFDINLQVLHQVGAQFG